jgi:hypothetical protein
VRGARAQTHLLEQFGRTRSSGPAIVLDRDHRGFDVLGGAERRDEVERLEHEADVTRADAGQLAVVEVGELATVEDE